MSASADACMGSHNDLHHVHQHAFPLDSALCVCFSSKWCGVENIIMKYVLVILV